MALLRANAYKDLALEEFEDSDFGLSPPSILVLKAVECCELSLRRASRKERRLYAKAKAD